LESIRKKYGEEHEYYITAFRELAYYYQRNGDDNEAFRLRNIALELTKKVYGQEHQKYIEELSSLAMDYENIDNYTEAIKLRNRAAEISKKIYGNESAEYASALNYLAFANSLNGNDTAAIRLGTAALEINKKIFGEEKTEYALCLSDIASFYAYAAYTGQGGSYTEAIRLQKKVVEVLKKNAVEDEKDDTFRYASKYGMALHSLASYYNMNGNYTEAVKYQILCIEHENEYRGSSVPYYELKRLADYYLSAGEYDKGVEIYKNIYETQLSEMSNEFAFLSNEDRARKWNEGYSYSNFFNEDLPFAAYKSKNNEIAALAYNGAVFSKGFLLNSELEIQNIIEQKGNFILLNDYNTIKSNRTMLDSLLQIPVDERTINADSLSNVIHQKEHEIVSFTKELGDYVGNLSIDWKEISKFVKDNDMAVEFVNFKTDDKKQTIYAALVIKKDMKSPEFVKLFTQDDFYDIPSDEYYKTTKLYNLVWKPLEKYLKEVKNVYFSPCGKFHTIGIEYLPDESGKIFAEKFNAYRLSSTRELALSKEINPNKKAATYGGIKYGEDNNGTGKRGVATYLKGSKIESDTVAKLLQSANYEVIALSDTIATEESFKKLSGTNLKILHIGTHGFYYSESDLENAGFSFFSNNNQQSEEDKALSCSGLLFAGANIALDKETRNVLPEGDDGILTAKEISRLDFKGLDLVVLSACQTGLGEVTGEGVFGLQRGFKKAGAQTIIMSLWEVDDYATRLSMTEFFKGLTAGKSKREAFLSALNFVKAKNSDPKYWAAFVMVDGKE
jgi:CHAT domain-containing protein